MGLAVGLLLIMILMVLGLLAILITGSDEIHDHNVFMQGMRSCADTFFGEDEEHVLIPEGFTEYVEAYYGEHRSFNSFMYVEHLEKDSKNAIAKWFELLDSYLISLGYEPIPKNDG